MQTTLLIMAAGIGSRFGSGIKQLETVDTRGHIIMDYSIHDAIEAGFNKIIFIIRNDIENDFKEVIGNRIEKVCKTNNVEVEYCFQSLEDIPIVNPYYGVVPEGRTKPWGTGQAVLAAKELINTPFIVINADDYYGKEVFGKMHDWLCEEHEHTFDFCMAGFVLKNTLSENGGVTRGICEVNEKGYLVDVVETSDIVKTTTGAAVNGFAVDADAIVSMNMWGFTPEFIQTLDENFKVFFEKKVPSNPLKAEYLLPILIGELLQKKEVTVQVIPTNDRWFGVTYASDKPVVVENFKKLVDKGIYKEDLFSDL